MVLAQQQTGLAAHKVAGPMWRDKGNEGLKRTEELDEVTKEGAQSYAGEIKVK